MSDATVYYPDWREARLEITRAISSLYQASREDDRDIIRRRHNEHTADGLETTLASYDRLMIHREQLLAQLDAERALVEEASRTIVALVAERDSLLATVRLCADAFETGSPKTRDAAFAAIRAALALAGGGQ